MASKLLDQGVTFGRTTQGGTNDTNGANFIVAGKHTFSGQPKGLVKSLWFYLAGGGTSAQTARAVIYDATGAAGAPGALVAVTAPITVTAAQAGAFVEFPLVTATSINAGDYWIGLWFTTTSSGFRWAYTTGGSNGNSPATYATSGNPPALTWTGGGTNLYSAYAYFYSIYVAATSTVSGSILRVKPIAAAQISATSTTSGTVSRVAAAKAITPTQISATSTTSGSARALRRIAPANISATSTTSGAVSKRAAVASAQISASSTCSGSARAVRKIAPAQISATASMSGSIGLPKRIVVANVICTSAVSMRTTAIFGYSTIGGSSALAGTSSVNYLDISGPYSMPGGTVVKLSARLSANGFGMKVRLVIYDDNSGNPNSLVATSVEQSYSNLTPAWADFSFASMPVLAAGSYWLGYWFGPQIDNGGLNVFYDTAANSEKFSNSGIAYSTSSNPTTPWPSAGGGTSNSKYSVYATYFTSFLSIAAQQISAASTISGAVRRLAGVAPLSISAASTTSGAVTSLRGVSGQVLATSTMSGRVSGLKKIAPTNISASSTAVGSVRKLARIVPTQINATSTASGTVVPLRRIAPANVNALCTAAGALTALRKLSGVVQATSTVSGAVKPLRALLPLQISAISTMTITAVGIRRAALTGLVSAVSTVAGRVTALRRVFAAQISAASAISGKTVVARAVLPTQISATSTVVATLAPLRQVHAADIVLTTTVSGSIRRARPLVAAITSTTSVSGYIIRRGSVGPVTISTFVGISGTLQFLRSFPGEMLAFSTVSGRITRMTSLVGEQIFAISSVSGYYAVGRGILPAAIISVSSVSVGRVQVARPISGNIFAIGTVQGDITLFSPSGVLTFPILISVNQPRARLVGVSP